LHPIAGLEITFAGNNWLDPVIRQHSIMAKRTGCGINKETLYMRYRPKELKNAEPLKKFAK
jgi:hypothetical protein